MQAQNFKIQQSGNNVGGSMSYAFDPSKTQDNLSYKFDDNYKIWGFSNKEVKQAGTASVDPKTLLSSLAKVGSKFNFGPLAVTVRSISGRIATCDLAFNGEFTANGSALVDISQTYIRIHHFNATGSKLGNVVNLIADEV